MEERIKANAFNKSSVIWMIIIVFALPIGLFLLLKSFGLTASIIVFSVSGGLLLFYIIANAILTIYLTKANINYKEKREKLLAEKDNLTVNAKKMRRKVQIISVLSYIYLLSYALIIILLNTGILLLWTVVDKTSYFQLLALSVSNYVIPILELILIYAYYAFYVPSKESHLLITPTEAIDLYNIVKAAKKECGLTKVYTPAISWGVGAHISKRHNGELFVCVGVETLMLLKPEELKAVFVHEFSHAAHKDTDYLFRVSNRLFKWQLLSTKRKPFPNFLFIPMAMYLHEEFTKFNLLSSYNLELLADKAFVKEESKHHMVNALAKMSLYNYFEFKLPSQSYYSDSNYDMQLKKKSFIDEYYANRNEWDSICINQLPAKIDTHPNLSERMKNLNVEKIDVDFEVTNEKYLAELEKIVKKSNDYVNESYDVQIREKYTKDIYEETIAAYENQKEKFDGDMLEVAFAYFETRNYDKALSIYETEDSHGKNPDAQYYKNIILSNKNDDSCIEGFVKLLKHPSYADSVYIRLGLYLQYRAMADERERLRPIINENMDRIACIANFKRSDCERLVFSGEVADKLNAILKTDEIKYAFSFKGTTRAGVTNTLVISHNIKDEFRAGYFVSMLFAKIMEILPDVYILISANGKEPPKSMLKKLNRIV